MAPAQKGYAPTYEKFEESLSDQPLERSVEELISLLKRRQIQGPDACANATAHLLSQVVSKSRWSDVDELLTNIQRVGTRLTHAAPKELVIGNIVRRVLGLVRDEASEDREGNEFGSDTVSEAEPPSPPRDQPKDYISARFRPIRPPILSSTSSFMTAKTVYSLLAADPANDIPETPSTVAVTPGPFGLSPSFKAMKLEVLGGIEEIVDEIRQVDDQIAAFAEQQIMPGDYVLVHQPSPTVERFLTRAASKRKFTVLITGDALRAKPSEPPYAALRKKLSSHGVRTILLVSTSTMAYMPRVSRVILGARAVLASGGVISDGGSRLVARAACEYSKPLLVLGGVYKLCPDEPDDPESLTELGDPSSYVDFTDATMVERVDVQSLATDFIPPELVSIYVTNLGPHSPAHLNGVIADHYKLEDLDFYTQ